MHHSSLIKNISFVLISFVTLFFSLRNIYGEDVGFHLRAAEWMTQNLSLPPNEAFIYTDSGKEYINLNWIYQLILYAVYSLWGSAGMILLNSSFILGAVYFLFSRIIHWNSLLLPWIILVGILAVSTSFEIRPHSLSWFFLGSTLYVLENYYNGNEKIIRWLPLIMVFWVNTHSLFVLGLVVLVGYVISVYRKNKSIPKRFLIYGTVATFICFLNPYGWRGFFFPFEQASALREGNIFKENIRELQSPFEISKYDISFYNIISGWHFFDLFVVITVISFLLKWKKFGIHERILSIIFFLFACSAVKNIGYFVFAVTSFIANVISQSKMPIRTKQQKKDGKYFKPIMITFILVCLFLLLTIRTNAFYIHYRASYRFGFGWSNSNLPINATEFLLKNNLHGKILNQLDFGGYLEFFAKTQTAIDGRLDAIGEKLFQEQVNANTDNAKDFLLRKYNPQIIIFSYFITPDWIVFLQKKTDWRLAYVDGNAAIYLRNDYAVSVPAVEEKDIMASLKSYSDSEIDSLVRKKETASIFSLLFKTQYFPEEDHNLLAFCFYYGWVHAAKQVSANAFVRATSDYPEIYQNLGSVYFQLKDKERSLYCYEKFLQKRENKLVAERVMFLKSL